MSDVCPPYWTVCRSACSIVGVKEQRITMGQLWDLIQEHIDAQPYPPSERRIALELGVSPTTLANWREPKRLLAKEHLVKIARLTRNPYRRVLDALLADIDYLDEGSGGSGRNAAPMRQPANARELRRKRDAARAAGNDDIAEQYDQLLAAIEEAEKARRSTRGA